ncbi:MAG: methylenetetrahydrofolate reductase [Abditibacteriota bacterium]|nr:methylenetetrahydrofolate reductase [Abditibacteriota bacterium]
MEKNNTPKGFPAFHVEIIPPKQDSVKLEDDLTLFAAKFERVMASGFTASITDNAMGLLAFQGHECIEELGLKARPGQVLIHLNTFHTKETLEEILTACQRLGIFSVLAISGDGSPRLPKLKPAEMEAEETEAVTSVELIRYIRRHYPLFTVGAAFNPYEPEKHEFEKLDRKLEAGAAFVITQPIIEKNSVVDRLLQDYPELPVTVEAWMSKKLYLLSDVVGYPIPEDAVFDPIDTLRRLRDIYPLCGTYLSLLGFKTQYELIEAMSPERREAR